MDVNMLDRAIKSTGAVVAGTKREQLDDPSPCSEWRVRDVLNHLISECLTFSSGAKGEARELSDGLDHCAEDHASAFDEAAKEVLDAFSEPGVMDREFAMPWGSTSGKSAFSLLLADAVVHGWDIAVGTGQEADIDDDISETVYMGVTKMMQPTGSYPRGDSFKDPVAVLPDASPVDKLVAYLGRDPNWAPE